MRQRLYGGVRGRSCKGSLYSINDKIPDHSSLSKIRSRYGEKVFEAFFDKIILLCKEHNIIKGDTIITDATLIEANASIDSMISKESRNTSDDEKFVGVVTSFSKRKLSNNSHISKSDPDSSLAMKIGAARSLKYKVHISIDKDSRVVLDSKVTTGSCHETQIYLDRLFHIKSKYNLEMKSVIADRAYGSSKNIKHLQLNSITGYIPLFSSRSGKIQSLVQKGFQYNKDNQEYICPSGIVMKGWKSGDRMIYKISDSICRNCSKKTQCSIPESQIDGYRRIRRSDDQDFFEDQIYHMKQKDFVNAQISRMWEIEGINSEAKNLHGLKRAKYRGLQKVQIQAYMIAAVMNLKRLITFLLFFNYGCISLIKIPKFRYKKYLFTFSTAPVVFGHPTLLCPKVILT
jgi:hypothetical protein